MPKVAIIGGGITGLTAAYTLERESDFEIVLLESSPQVGGKIQTSHGEGFTVEAGPDSIFVGKPGALDLIKDLGLEDQVVEPTASGFQLLIGERLYPVPPGLASLAGVSHGVIEHATFLSDEGKKRAWNEMSVPPGDGQEESISSFFTRRFGEEFCRFVAEPILAGTHGGDPERLSMRALYPMYVEREQKNGNLSTPVSGAHAPKGPMFLSFKNGMATLTDSLKSSLKRTQMHTGVSTIQVERDGRVRANDETLEIAFDHLLLTIPSDNAAELLGNQEETANLLSSIRLASSVIVTTAYPKSALPRELCGTGFLTPFSRHEILTGCTWSSSKWPNRAPEDMMLIRFFFGGDGRPELGTDEQLISETRKAAANSLGIQVDSPYIQVYRWEKALPQYELGHTKLVDRIEENLAGSPFSVAGSCYRGVGIPDCIRQGREAARKIAEALS